MLYYLLLICDIEGINPSQMVAHLFLIQLHLHPVKPTSKMHVIYKLVHM